MDTLLSATQLCRDRQELEPAVVEEVIAALLDERTKAGDKADFLRALTAKGETAAELRSFAHGFLQRAIDPGFSGAWEGKPIFDCAGTGGGGRDLINISTAIIFILAAAGVPVVKHGNRGVTKKSGSADVIEALGLKIEMTPAQLRASLGEVGLGFIFARAYHPAFAALAPVRQTLGAEGRRTIFNLLGVLVNPARPAAQLIGVFKPAYLDLFAEALRGDCARFAIIYGEDSHGTPLGEVSPHGRNRLVAELGGQTIEIESAASPEETDYASLLVISATDSARRIVALLTGKEKGLGRDLLIANAAAGFLVHGTSKTWTEAAALAAEIIDSGRAYAKLRQWQSFCEKL